MLQVWNVKSDNDLEEDSIMMLFMYLRSTNCRIQCHLTAIFTGNYEAYFNSGTSFGILPTE